MQPEQISFESLHIAVALAPQPREQRRRPLGHRAFWKRIADRLQFGPGGGITSTQPWETGEQLHQIEQSLQIQQA